MAITKKSDLDKANYAETLPYVKEALANLRPSFDELKAYRTKEEEVDKSYNNVFSGAKTASLNAAGVLRSGFCHVAVEQAMRGMLMPVFRTDAVNRTGMESKNAQALSKGVMEWYIKESGFSSAYIDSKEEWAKSGDSFRRPFLLPMKKKGQYWPQYEDLDPGSMLLDISGAVIWSETISRSMSFVGYTQIYTDAQVKREFGKEALKLATEGAMIDTTRYAERTGESDVKSGTKYYEVIIYQNCADEVELTLLGKNAVPVHANIEGDEVPKKPSELKGVMKATNKYIHRDKFGRPVLRFYQNFFYFDKTSPRNRGLVDKLAPIQLAHEDMENSKLESTKLRMFEIPTVAGGREAAITKSIKKFIVARQTNVFSVLHAPQSGVDGAPPKFDMLRFNGLPAQDANMATEELYSLARNTAGIAVKRLEVDANATLGQSQIIEQEKVDSIEGIILRNKPLLEHEYEGILDYIISMDGFGLDDVEITVDFWKKIDGIAGEDGHDVMTQKSISIQEAARQLKDTRFKVVIDDSSLVNRTYSTMMDEWVRLLGIVNPEAQPELYKWVLARIAQAGRFDIPENILDPQPKQQAQQPMQAMGGASQFQASPGAGGAPEQPAMGEEPPMDAITAGGGGVQNPLDSQLSAKA